MWKAVMASASLVLLVGAGVQGSIIVQDQGLVIGTTNGINLLQGNESSNSSQTLILNMTQNGTGAGSLFGSAHQIGLTMPSGGISGISAMANLGQSLMLSGQVSRWTLNSLGDQARLHAMMLSMN